MLIRGEFVRALLLDLCCRIEGDAHIDMYDPHAIKVEIDDIMRKLGIFHLSDDVDCNGWIPYIHTTDNPDMFNESEYWIAYKNSNGTVSTKHVRWNVDEQCFTTCGKKYSRFHNERVLGYQPYLKPKSFIE